MRDNNLRTPLHIACYNNSIDVVKFLLTFNEIDINAQDICGDTPLHKACNYNNEEIVKILIRLRGININIKNNQGKIPIKMTSNERIHNLLIKK
ncbi:ankyrin repeat protein, putative [Trichomonas vaginalis G3]|uniref:Ankyrin repeat protein, putative n=1 Tax=Trichomonas vaginalis (strain ATCC PRA-98 / G3) TaxID=412133 RepID=A2D7X1_TRIV3|nr:ankyrin repeat domain-containing protein 49 family [Trichomonas vaginalis G3]EAY23404.1 ankyrin repeat protein, putative [Trichomonas vaginalis G3]KAI5493817.1 ankyrin repeat domain-containing protein 49 family [Trichomonas vaginalis G3]|eukprot:XP_001584390.1 ankyrin repeat protein [Trichomonas vaginalis G3]